MSSAPLATEPTAPTVGQQLVLELRDVTRTYGPPPVHALRGVNLTVAAGEYLALTGPSGAGKSTLLNIMGLLDRPTNGDVLIDGEPTRQLSESVRSYLRGTKIGFVFQAFHLLPHRTALESVALAGLYRHIPRRQRYLAARDALDRVGLSHRLVARCATLSGGEKQRVAIARAIVTDPALLMCDEPTGNLDSATTAGILSLLDQLATSGSTIIVITHDPVVASHAQRSVSVRDGTVEDRP